MGQRNITLSIDEGIYESYKKYCQDNAIALSKSVEIFMRKKLEGF